MIWSSVGPQRTKGIWSVLTATGAIMIDSHNFKCLVVLCSHSAGAWSPRARSERRKHPASLLVVPVVVRTSVWGRRISRKKRGLHKIRKWLLVLSGQEIHGWWWKRGSEDSVDCGWPLPNPDNSSGVHVRRIFSRTLTNGISWYRRIVQPSFVWPSLMEDSLLQRI